MTSPYNFTDSVRESLRSAREEATRLRHDYVGTEHILLGLLRVQGSVGLEVLKNLGIDLDGLAGDVEKAVDPGAEDTDVRQDLPYTTRAKKVLELSMSEARDLENHHVGTEHLLLGLVKEEKSIAAHCLVGVGITQAAIRGALIKSRALAAEAAGRDGTETQPLGPHPIKYTIVTEFADGSQQSATFERFREAMHYMAQWIPRA